MEYSNILLGLIHYFPPMISMIPWSGQNQSYRYMKVPYFDWILCMPDARSVNAAVYFLLLYILFYPWLVELSSFFGGAISVPIR